MRADFLKPAEIDRGMKEAVAGLGGSVDILVNNVGDLIQRVPFDDFETSMWDNVIALNLSSVYHACAIGASQHPAEDGRIVNISSLRASTALASTRSLYAAAKGGMVALTKRLANEFASARDSRELRRPRVS